MLLTVLTTLFVILTLISYFLLLFGIALNEIKFVKFITKFTLIFGVITFFLMGILFLIR